MTSPRTVVRVALAVALVQAVFVLAYVAPGHNAKPHGLPVAVVGPSPAAEALADRFQRNGIDAVPEPTEADARRAIVHRDAYGAVLLGGAHTRVLTASAASITAEQVVVAAGSRAGARPKDVKDVVPLTGKDPRGAAFGLLVVPLLVTSILGALLAQAQMGKAITPFKRLLALTAAAATAGTLTTIMIDPVFGILPGSFLAKAGLLTLAVGGILLIVDALLRLLGPSAIALSFFLFVVIGSPSSGASTAPEMVPGPWRQIGGFVAPGPIVNGLRDIAYFDGASLTKPILALVGTLAVGCALQGAAEIRRGRAAARSDPAAGPAPAVAVTA